MLLNIPYGQKTLEVRLPPGVCAREARLAEPAALPDGAAEVWAALDNLIGAVDVAKIAAAESVAIAVSDATRPVPNRVILPALLAKLAEWGVAREKVFLVVGGGLHRPPAADELKSLLGEELYGTIPVFAHDACDGNQLAFLGHSRAGTPIYVNARFAAAQVRISTGMIDPHQFMGYTAGVKGVVVGLGGKETIETNHARMFAGGAELGRIDGNPAREDLEDIGAKIGVDMIVNVVLDAAKRIVKAVAGHPVTAHRAGLETAQALFGVPVAAADIVIASPGGYPKDINVYQAQKALTPAALAVRPGGAIILVAECREGAGEELFEQEMARHATPAEVVAAFRRGPFVIGAHKAFLWARTLAATRTILVSDRVPADLARLLMIEVRATLQDALDDVLPRYDAPDVLMMPNASSLVPILAEEQVKSL